MTHPTAEYVYGITLPGMAGMFTRLYMEKYGVTREMLTEVAIKNQMMGALNPFAHVEMAITKEGISDSPHSIVNNPLVADPLRLYDACPVSDGAAAVLLCPLEMAQKAGKPPVMIAGFGQATDTQTLQERDDPTDLKAVTLAAQQAFEMAQLKPADIHVAELHDAFTILEIAESEHVGFFPKGQGGQAVLDCQTRLGGKIPINVSGGLKARGHPVGATGVAQVVEITFQLRHEVGKQRQVKNAQNGLTDYSHPCQAMADYLTVLEVKQRISGLKVTYVGDGNNVARSLMFAGAQLGANVWIATPADYEPDGPAIEWTQRRCAETNASVTITNDPELAVHDADVVYTDVWASMGQESETEQRKKIFAPYQVNAKLFGLAKPDAMFLHCLPAHRGDEVTSEVIDSPR
ncbi:MAG TPA: hypothetical protein VF498_17775, partial [Anaerolineales bacterium]